MTADDIGSALVVLSLVFAASALIRRWCGPLRALFIPTAVIGGFLAMGLGPEGIGRINDSNGIFSQETFRVWTALPGMLINVMCASLLLGERLPSLGKIWNISAPHVIMGGVMSFGQFAVAGVLTLLVLTPVFDMSPKAGALIEMSFAGGHGTLAGLSDVLVAHDAGYLVDVGLGLATIGMVAGIVVGTMLVNYAVKNPNIPIARQNPTSRTEDLDIDHHLPGPDDEPLDGTKGMSQVTAALVFLGVSIAIGWVILEVLRWSTNQVNVTIFDTFPLFPFTIIGGVLVQIAAMRFNFTWAVNRSAVEGLGGIAVDGIIVCAIGTLSLAAIGNNIGPIIILSVASVGWSVFMAMVIGKRLMPQDWFEHSIAEFGESQGNVATGFMMVDMVDPGRQTGVVMGYGYRQLITRPLIGGGFITALSVPIISAVGLTAFTIIFGVLAVAMTVWGIRRVGKA